MAQPTTNSHTNRGDSEIVGPAGLLELAAEPS